MAAPKCMACNVERRLAAVEPIAEHYEIRSFECPNCKTVIRLVVRREQPTILNHG